MEGMPELRVIENEFLTVKINDKGAELWEIWNKETNEQLIWDGRPEIWNRRTPVLFPFVGRSAGDEYTYGNQSYPMGQHGFARDMVFAEVEQGEDYVVHELCANEQSKQKYPFDFCFRVTHKLEKNELLVSWEVENRGKEKMYFKIGGHPGFLLPEMEGNDEVEYSLHFPEKEKLTYFLITPDTGLGMPEETYELSLQEGCHPIGRHLFDKDALIFDGGQITEVSILRPDKSRYVTLCCEGFPSVGIWAKPGAPYVCLEPWDGRCDNVGCCKELEQKPGVNCLEPEEVYKKGYRIRVAE